MSFAFTESSDYSEEYGDNFVTHHIRKFRRIWDVSGVDIPAYDATEIYALGEEEERSSGESYAKQEKAYDVSESNRQYFGGIK